MRASMRVVRVVQLVVLLPVNGHEQDQEEHENEDEDFLVSRSDMAEVSEVF